MSSTLSMHVRMISMMRVMCAMRMPILVVLRRDMRMLLLDRRACLVLGCSQDLRLEIAEVVVEIQAFAQRVWMRESVCENDTRYHSSKETESSSVLLIVASCTRWPTWQRDIQDGAVTLI